MEGCLGKARGGSKGDDGSSSEITCNHSGGGRMCTGKGILKGGRSTHICLSKVGKACDERGVLRTSHVSPP